MIDILDFIASHWIGWFFAIFASIGSFAIRKVLKRMETKLDEEHQKQEAERLKSIAMAEGMQCLLRDAIVSSYSKYTRRGYCPIYAKESLKRGYNAYHSLGGNDIATKLYITLRDMPEEPPAERRKHEE